MGKEFAIPWIPAKSGAAGPRELLQPFSRGDGIPRGAGSLRVPSSAAGMSPFLVFSHLPLQQSRGNAAFLTLKLRGFSWECSPLCPGIPGLGNVPPSLCGGEQSRENGIISQEFPSLSLSPAKPFLEGLIPNKSQISNPIPLQAPPAGNHAATPESSPGFLLQEGIPSCP